MLGYSVFAQTTTSGAASVASTEVDVSTGAIAGSQINSYGQKAGKDNRTYQEVSAAPSLGGLALGGGHPCAYSPATAQISLIGGGAGIGGMKVDSACMLVVMGAAGDPKAYKAAQYMLAARDPSACVAMRSAGMIADTSECGESAGFTRPRKDFSAPVAASSKGVNTGTGAKCEKVGNRITFRATSVAAQSAELSACKALF
jgi:hypothetical protein